jgi:hypothetical protein
METLNGIATGYALGNAAEVFTQVRRGESFTIAGRDFTHDGLRHSTDERLSNLLVNLVKDGEALDLAGLYMAAIREARWGAACILADLEASEAPEDEAAEDAAIIAMEAWLSRTRGVKSSELVDLVIGYTLAQGHGQLLGRLFNLAVLAGAVAPPRSAGVDAGPSDVGTAGGAE